MALVWGWCLVYVMLLWNIKKIAHNECYTKRKWCIWLQKKKLSLIENSGVYSKGQYVVTIKALSFQSWDLEGIWFNLYSQPREFIGLWGQKLLLVKTWSGLEYSYSCLVKCIRSLNTFTILRQTTSNSSFNNKNVIETQFLNCAPLCLVS